MKIHLTASDLVRIADFAKFNYIDLAPGKLSPLEFNVKCYVEAVTSYLASKGLEITITYDSVKDTVRDDD